jgi:hypothetical protein
VKIVTSDQWLSVETSFDALHDLSFEERASGLAAIGDEDVRNEVASLLRHAESDAAISTVVRAMAIEAQAEGLRRKSRP